LVRGVKGAYEKSLRALKELVDLRDSKYPQLSAMGVGHQRPLQQNIWYAQTLHMVKSITQNYG